MPDQQVRISVVIEARQRARLEELKRRVNQERDAELTLSHLVRDAIDAYLQRPPSSRLQRLAESKPAYRVD